MDSMILRAVLSLDSSKYEKGLDNAEKKATTFGGKVKKAFGLAVKASAVVASGAVALGGTMLKLAGDTAKYGDNVDKMSQKIGISAKAYQQWDYVMKRSGTSVDNLKAGMKTLSKQVEAGSKDFEKLGISQKELKNSSTEEILEKTIKGLAGMKEGTERTALATKLLGRAGMDMAPLLNQGTKAIDEQMEMAEKYGMVMSDKTVKASAKFTDSMTTLNGTVKGLKNRFMGEFLPSLTKVTNGLSQLIVGDTDKGIENIRKGIEGFASKMDKVVPKFLEMGGKILTALGDGIMENLPSLATKVVDVMVNLSQYFIDYLPEIIDTGIQILMALGEGLNEALPKLMAQIPKLLGQIAGVLMKYNWIEIGASIIGGILKGIMAMMAGFLSPFEGIKNSIVNTAKGIVNGVANTFNGIVKAITSPIDKANKAVNKTLNNMKSSMSKVFTTIKSTASKAWNGIKSAMTKPIENAKNAIKKVINTVKSYFPLSVGKIFSNIKLPKITVSGGKAPWGFMGQGKAPSFGLKWYDRGGIFNSPSVIGVGEKRPEFVGALDDLRQIVREESGSGQVIINVYPSENQNSKDVAREVERMLIKNQNRKRVAWQ